MYHFFNYKNIQIRYTSTGKGSAVILLHGFLENLGMWNAIVPELAKRNRVIAIDLLGHGESENLGYIHTMEDQAKMVKAVLNHLRLRKYILIGHSMGGYVGLAFSKTYSDTIKGICLMNSTAIADTKEKRINRDRAIKAVKQNHKAFIKVAIPNLFSKDNRPVFKIEILQITKEALEISTQGIIASLEGMKTRKDRSEILTKGSFQKMLIIGKKDPVLGYKSLINQTKNTNIRIIEFPDGHMSHIENKNALIVALKDFVKSCN
jgi:pimeloyl-ACP methyl ester carboxylesterase